MMKINLIAMTKNKLSFSLILLILLGVLSTSAQVILMPTAGTDTVYTCKGIFSDSGGPNWNGTNYSNNENGTLIVCPSISGRVMTVIFTHGLYLANFGDRLKIYGGIGTGGILIASIPGFVAMSTCDIFFSNDSTGCLTFTFTSDSSSTTYGWDATLVCLDSMAMLPPGRTCATAFVIPSLPFYEPYESTTCYENNYINQAGICATYTGNEDKVYQYTALGPECIGITLSNIIIPLSIQYVSYSVYQGCPGSGGVCVGSNYATVTAIPGYLTGTVNLPGAGTYYIMIDGGVGGYIDYDISIVACSIGMEEQDLLTSFTISPNPSNDIFMLQTNSTEKADIFVTNILGGKIYSQRIVSEKTEINLSYQPNGIYFVTVVDEKGNKAVKKFVKM